MGDYVNLWQVAEADDVPDDVSPRDLIDYVIGSIEPGLRSGAIRAGRVYHLEGKGPFNALDWSVDEVLDRVRSALESDQPDWIEIDISFDTTPK
jgi:hypothetical protein